MFLACIWSLQRPRRLLPITDLDHEIAEGVRALQRLQEQIDKELFSANPDPDVLNSLWGQQNFVRDRLAAHGIRVRA